MNFKSFLLLSLISTQCWGYTAAVDSSLRELIEESTPETCSKSFDKVSKTLSGLKKDDYLEELKKADHKESLDKLWSLKISAHDKLREFYKKEAFSLECATSARGALKAIRFTEDIVSDHFKRNSSEKFPDNAFGEGNIHVRRSPQFKDFHMKNDLKSGDIILSRGNAYTSAAISSLGEFDTQFSHMSVVYRDEKNELWTVEAHIEVGSFVRPLQDHIDDKNFRSMIFRSEDEVLAAKAAKFIFDKVKKASDTTGNIFYDFGFDQDDSQKLFCSEVASLAFDVASSGKLKMPLFRSRLMTRKPDFVKTLEISVSDSFIPADIEVDPRFKVIAEWRDANKIQDIVEKDEVLHAMFRWNDELGYKMVQASSGKSLLYRNVAWPLRRVPFLKKYFKEKLPINMSRKLIGYFGVLESIGELLQKELKVANNTSYKESGLILMSQEQQEFLENYRLKDKVSKKKLHKMYKPKKSK